MKTYPQALPFAVVLLAAACSGSNTNPTVECKETADCNLSAGGACLVYEPTGHKWCAYPDQTCPDGMRWSAFGTGDGLSGACVPDTTPDAAPPPPDAMPDGRPPPDAPPDAMPPDGQPDAMPTQVLTVLVGGNGTGHITSSPAGIDCPGTCTATFNKGQSVSLTEAPSSSVFLGWSTDCSGNGSCSVTLDQDRTVGALFGIAGSNVWLKQLGTTMSGSNQPLGAISSAKATTNGDIVVGGGFGGQMMLGATPTVSAGGVDGFVAKLAAANGSPMWIRQFGGTTGDTVTSVDVDPNGDVLVVGSFTGTATFNGTAKTSAGGSDVFVAKLKGTDGSYIWAKTFGGTGNDSPAGVVADPSGNVLVAGAFRNSIAPASQTLMSAGADDIFMIKYSPSGVAGWSKSLGGAGNDDVGSPGGVAVDDSGNLVIAGYFSQTVDFGNGAATSANGSASFVGKYAAADGGYLAAQEIGLGGGNHGNSVTVDSAGNMYLAGNYNGSLVIGSAATLNSVSGSWDVYVVKFSIAGSYQWSKSFGNDADDDGVSSIRLDAHGQLLLTGQFTNTVNYGSNLTAAGGDDIFVAELTTSNGFPIAAIRLGGTGSETAQIAVGAPNGDLFIGGGFTGFSEFGGVALSAATSSSQDGFALLVQPLN